jgi:hypothetical protein
MRRAGQGRGSVTQAIVLDIVCLTRLTRDEKADNDIEPTEGKGGEDLAND